MVLGTGMAPNEANLVAGDAIVNGTWTSCTFDGTALTLVAASDDTTIEVEPTDGGNATVVATGTTALTGTGSVEEATGRSSSAGRRRTRSTSRWS
jgi:hypothetical protein